MAVVLKRKQATEPLEMLRPHKQRRNSSSAKPRTKTPSSTASITHDSCPYVSSASPSPSPYSRPGVPPEMEPQLARIAHSERTDFEKSVWTALCQIPRGCVTTYGLLSTYLGTSPRAVGNALRRNPFAPDVPCHRVVATGGTLGGFKGSWPKNGEGITITEKRNLLRSEGIRLDDKGKVIGTVWSGFV